MQKIIKITIIDDWNNETTHHIICDETEVEGICSKHLKTTSVTNIQIITPSIVTDGVQQKEKSYKNEIVARLASLVSQKKCIWDGVAFVKSFDTIIKDKNNFDILHIGYGDDGLFFFSSNEDDTEQIFITINDIDEKNLQLIIKELDK